MVLEGTASGPVRTVDVGPHRGEDPDLRRPGLGHDTAILACTSASPWARASSGLSFTAFLRSRMVSCIAARSSSLKTLPVVLAELLRLVDGFVSVMSARPLTTRDRSGAALRWVSSPNR
jgi:hypothetical protein